MSRAFCVCVPARDEAARLPTLLAALAAQSVDGRVPVALCVNNSEDGSAEVARRAGEGHRDRLELRVVERVFPPGADTVGAARRCAMDAGAALLGGDDAILISTDADCRPPPDWIAAILAVATNDPIIGGRLAIDDAEPAPPAPSAIGRRLERYWAAVRAIEDGIDPRPWDPPPRHGDHTGASLALSVGLLRAAGGVPPLASSEDLALVERARIAGGLLVHPPGVWTRVSPRRDGRAPGGMASALAAFDDAAPMVPGLEHWRRRARWRREIREAGLGDAVVAERERRLPAMPSDQELPELEDWE